MKYVHIRNLEKYHPGYKDRSLQWAKIHFRMVQGDPDCEMIENEIDWARLIKIILLELEAQSPIPINDSYLKRKGFNLKTRPISLTLNMLHNFIQVIHTKSETCVLDKRREEEEKEKSRDPRNKKAVTPDLSEPILYLNQKAGTTFQASNKSNQDLVRARYKEGRTIEDFKNVIDRKCGEWINDEKMFIYLRPSTLFNRTKFENYLNQAVKDPEWLKQAKEDRRKLGGSNGSR